MVLVKWRRRGTTEAGSILLEAARQPVTDRGLFQETGISFGPYGTSSWTSFTLYLVLAYVIFLLSFNINYKSPPVVQNICCAFAQMLEVECCYSVYVHSLTFMIFYFHILDLEIFMTLS